jgi:hypothetical protein
VEEVQAAFGNIRVMLDKFRNAEAVPVGFAIAFSVQHAELQNRADLFIEPEMSLATRSS